MAFVAVLAAIGLIFHPALRVPASGGEPRVAVGWEPYSDARLAQLRAEGRSVFVDFTADWCLTCKANEAAAIERDETQKAFSAAGVITLVGDWTDGDPAITRFLETRGRAGVPVYLWYEPGSAEPEELPQVLTPAMLSSRAARPR